MGPMRRRLRAKVPVRTLSARRWPAAYTRPLATTGTANLAALPPGRPASVELEYSVVARLVASYARRIAGRARCSVSVPLALCRAPSNCVSDARRRDAGVGWGSYTSRPLASGIAMGPEKAPSVGGPASAPQRTFPTESTPSRSNTPGRNGSRSIGVGQRQELHRVIHARQVAGHAACGRSSTGGPACRCQA